MNISDVPRSGRSGRLTEAGLRKYFRARVAQHDGMDRTRYAYGVLSASALSGDWTMTQLRGIAKGLELGMDEGTR